MRFSVTMIKEKVAVGLDLTPQERNFVLDCVDEATGTETSVREKFAKIAEDDPELPGDMPEELNLVPLEDALRAAVRATKKSIAAAIRRGRR